MKKFTFTLLLILFISIITNTAEAQYTLQASDVVINANGELTEYTSPDTSIKDIVIPNKFGDITVTSIGNFVFQSATLTRVILPSSLTSIGSYAFHNNNLTSVTIPSSVTSIGRIAFADNNLTSVTIPNSVTNIGGSAFRDNKLTRVILPSSLTKIEGGTFRENNLTSVIIPSSVTKIENSAFAYNKLTSVIIPSSVTSIEGAAFYNNKLTSVHFELPSSVKTIKRQAFLNNDSLKYVILPETIFDTLNFPFWKNENTQEHLKINDTITEFDNAYQLYFSVAAPTGITEKELFESIDVYPNPVRNQINIEYDKPYTYKIISTTGKELYHNKGVNQKETVNLDFLESGIYFLKITTSNNTITKRILKL